jgi:tetratricopeptide (TPR) repeat protein
MGCGGRSAIPGIEDRENKLPPLPPRENLNRQAYAYYSNGSILELMGNFPMANKQYEEALKIYPSSSEIRYAYAVTFFEMNDYHQSLSEAQNIKPRDLRSRLLIADNYRAIGNNDSAMAVYKSTLGLDSNNTSVYHFMGAYYNQQEKYDSSIWAYENLARIDPNYQIYQEIGNLYIRTKQLDNARKYYSLSVAMDSSAGNVRSYIGLSLIFEATGDAVEAKRYLEKAAVLSPQNIFVLSKLLDYYQSGNELDKAISVALTMIPIVPTDQAVKRRLGILYYDADSLKPADSIFTNLIDDGDDNIINYYYSGRISLMLNDLSRAKDRFKKMTVVADSVVDGWLNLSTVYQAQDSGKMELSTLEIALNHVRNLNDSTIIMFSLAAALQKNDQFERSVNLFEKIILLSPNHSQSLNYLGYMLAEKGMKLDYAMSLIKKALSILPDNGAYVDSYGWVLYQLGDYQKALEELLKANQLAGDDPVILEHIGDAYNALHDTSNSRIYWEKALYMDLDNKGLKEKLGR